MSRGEGEIKRWTAKRKAAVVLEILKGKTTASALAREHGLTVGEIERWQERFLSGAEEFLRSSPRENQERHDAEKQELLAKVGELTLAVDALKKTQRAQGLLPDRES